MAANKQSGQKMRQTMIAKFGSEEAWKQWLRERAAIGGSRTHSDGAAPKGFATFSKSKLQAAGHKGGSISRRGKAK